LKKPAIGDIWITESGSQVLEMKCALCSASNNLTEHHLIPRCRHKRYQRKKTSEELNKTILLCFECHKQIHSLFTETLLAQKYHTLRELKANPLVVKWVQWFKKF